MGDFENRVVGETDRTGVYDANRIRNDRFNYKYSKK
jgi:hypothetical protein